MSGGRGRLEEQLYPQPKNFGAAGHFVSCVGPCEPIEDPHRRPRHTDIRLPESESLRLGTRLQVATLGTATVMGD